MLGNMGFALLTLVAATEQNWQAVCRDPTDGTFPDWRLELSEPSRLSKDDCDILRRLAFEPPEPLASPDLVEKRLRAAPYFENVHCDTQFTCRAQPRRILRKLRISEGPPFPLLDRDISQRFSLRSGSLITDESLSKAKERLVNFLRNDGFLNARVELRVESISPRHFMERVDLHVAITESEKATLGTVKVASGTLPPDVNPRDFFEHYWLFGVVAKRFQPGRFRDDLHTLEAFLRKKGWPEARIRGVYDLHAGRADVSLHVSLGDKLILRFVGNEELDHDDLAELSTFADNGIIDGYGVQELIDAVELAYQRECFPEVQISAKTLNPSKGITEVELSVREGEYAPVEIVSIEGPQEVLDLIDEDDLYTRESGLIDRCATRHRLARDKEFLRELLREQGYMEAAVEHRVESASGSTEVIFLLQTGRRALVERLDYELPDGQDPPEVPMDEGEPYVANHFEEQQLVIRSWLAEQGYVDAKIDTQVTHEPRDGQELYTINYGITPGVRARTGGILLQGNFRTSRRLLEQELGITIGEPIDALEMAAGERRLRDLGVFRSVRVGTFSPISNKDTWVAAKLQEREVLGVDAVASWSTNDRLALGIDFSDRNFLGRAIILAATGRFGNATAFGPDTLKLGNRNRVSLSVRVPRPFGVPVTFVGDARYDVERKALFSEDELGGSVGVQHVFLSKNTCKDCPRVQGELRYELTRQEFRGDQLVTDETQTIGRIVFSLGVQGTDPPVDPRSGFIGDFRTDLALPEFAGPLGSDVGFVRLSPSFQWLLNVGIPLRYHSDDGTLLGGPVVFAFLVSGGWLKRLADGSVPSSQTFVYGGDFSLRGASERASLLALEKAERLLRGTFEVRWYFAQNLAMGHFQLAGFIDAATVSQNRATLFEELSVSAGPVLRYVTPVGPLSLSYGKPLVRAPGITAADPSKLSSKGRVHFTFGASF